MSTILSGLEVWLRDEANRWRGARLGLVTHHAAIGRDGISALDRLVAAGLSPVCVFTPEHGYWGAGGAGEEMPDERHPLHGLPIHSLYGRRRTPTREHWAMLDVLLVDLQDLGVRCYTYVSTLRDVLESAATAGKPVIVLDRPCPLATVVDGPMVEPGFGSFVAHVPAPLVYGMTIGETARWLRSALRLDLDLRVVPMDGYRADGRRPPDWPWIPPSPGIRTWESAWGYPVGVFSEALPWLCVDRGGPLSFQVLAVAEPEPADGVTAAPSRPDLHPTGRGLWDVLVSLPWRGADVCHHRFRTGRRWHAGARLIIREPRAWRPAETAVRLLEAAQRAWGVDAVWRTESVRPDWFDRLWGTASVRDALQRGVPADEIIAAWQTPARGHFDDLRVAALLYPRP